MAGGGLEGIAASRLDIIVKFDHQNSYPIDPASGAGHDLEFRAFDINLQEIDSILTGIPQNGVDREARCSSQAGLRFTLLVADLKAVIPMAAVEEEQFFILPPQRGLDGGDLRISRGILPEHFIVGGFWLNRDDLRLRVAIGEVNAGQAVIGARINDEAGGFRLIKLVMPLDQNLLEDRNVGGADPN